MKLVKFLLQYVALGSSMNCISSAGSLRNDGCQWTECHTNNKTSQNEVNCPSEQTEIDSKPCNEDNKGLMLHCCPKGTNGRQDPNVLWWPNDEGVLTKAFINCPITPDIPGAEAIKFNLYTKNNTNTSDYKELMVDDDGESLKESGFIIGAPVKMIIHGFMSSAESGPAKTLRECYLKLSKPMNIIAVDWPGLANYYTFFNRVCYNIAAMSVVLVGKRSALLLELLVEQGCTNVTNIHTLGHSLGAHGAGFTGKNFSKGKLPRITGLDPARPSFTNVDSTKRIDYTDADFVDIIHTATKDYAFLGPITMGSLPLGLEERIGHVDFFPNTGTNQPGCAGFLDGFQFQTPPSCSHARSYQFYAESIKLPTNKMFKGILCHSYEEVEQEKCNGTETDPMGEYTIISNRSRLMYFLKTNSKSPYAMDDP